MWWVIQPVWQESGQETSSRVVSSRLWRKKPSVGPRRVVYPPLLVLPLLRGSSVCHHNLNMITSLPWIFPDLIEGRSFFFRKWRFGVIFESLNVPKVIRSLDPDSPWDTDCLMICYDSRVLLLCVLTPFDDTNMECNTIRTPWTETPSLPHLPKKEKNVSSQNPKLQNPSSPKHPGKGTGKIPIIRRRAKLRLNTHLFTIPHIDLGLPCSSFGAPSGSTL